MTTKKFKTVAGYLRSAGDRLQSKIFNHLVPDAAKNRLLTDKELFAAVPELAPQRSRRGTR